MIAPRNPIRTFAVVCVAVTSLFVMWMSYRLITILSSPDWCGKALQAERISSQNFGGLTACVSLLTIQLKSLANNSLVFGGVIALCLLTLIVIVIAGGRLSFKGPGGIETDISMNTAAKAADQVAGAAVDKADQIKGAPDARGSSAHYRHRRSLRLHRLRSRPNANAD